MCRISSYDRCARPRESACSQYVAVCCSAWQCVTVFCSVLQCVAVCCIVYVSHLRRRSACVRLAASADARGLTNQRVRSMLQCVAACCSVLQCVAVCCSVLQCVAVCCMLCTCVAGRRVSDWQLRLMRAASRIKRCGKQKRNGCDGRSRNAYHVLLTIL